MGPESGSSSPAIMRRTVLLPEPLGPRSAVMAPSAAEKLTLSTARNDPNDFVRSLTSMVPVTGRPFPGSAMFAETFGRLDADEHDDGEEPERQCHDVALIVLELIECAEDEQRRRLGTALEQPADDKHSAYLADGPCR